MSSRPPTFQLVPLADLLEHEEIDVKAVAALAQQIESAGEVEDPIWVAAGTGVILNGHHRVQALKSLGAERAPAWVFDYASDAVELGRWGPGPAIAKDEVVQRAREKRLFTPKTTRHRIAVELPRRVTPLRDLMPGAAGAGTAQRRASGRSRSGAGATGST
jgi:L-serine kinase (ADP)